MKHWLEKTKNIALTGIYLLLHMYCHLDVNLNQWQIILPFPHF